MMNFFDTLIEYISFFFSLIVNIFQSLGIAVGAIVNAQNFILFCLGYMPAIIGAAFAIFFFIYVLKFILGR